MLSHRLWIVGLTALLAAASLARADAPAAADPTAADVQALAARIDQIIGSRWAAANARPADPADDAAFLRRVWLDVAGKVPPVAEVRRFVRDPDPDKRRKAVERLLDEPAYINHFTNVFRALLLPEADNNFQVRYLSYGFEAWLRKKLEENAGYDDMVREILTVPVPDSRRGFYDPYGQAGQPTPFPFYYAKEMKAENLAASSARIFLGVRLECAQCHDHPFAQWKREQFWGLAAFFGGIQGKGQDGYFNQIRELPDRRELAIPGTERVAQASFLDGKEPQWKFKTSARVTLADWVASADNPFFARAMANRMWAHFFGLGIVEPVDDFKDDNAPSHPDLLDELARQFAAHKFDIKFLVRTITATRAYQLSSVVSDPSQDDARLFARMQVKGLTAEQVLASLAQATGSKDPLLARPQLFNFDLNRNDFLAKFGGQDKKTEYQTAIPQALLLMNGNLVATATSVERSETLAAVAEAPFLDTAGKVETLYLSTLSRRPKPEEAARMVQYVQSGGPKKDPKRALADVFWALLNSGEFILNH